MGKGGSHPIRSAQQKKRPKKYGVIARTHTTFLCAVTPCISIASASQWMRNLGRETNLSV